MRLSVIGCGHLGAVHAACMAEIGHDVLGVDIDEGKVSLLNSGRAWFYEPGLDEMLSRNVTAGKLQFSTEIAEAAEFAEVHFLGVATPGRPDGAYDLSHVINAVTSLVRYVRGPCLVVGKSTVPPGTTASLSAIAVDACRTGRIDFSWNPEFLREGSAVQDTLMPDRIVVGVASDSAEAILCDIYRPLTDAGIPLIVTDFVTAELAKGAANAFLATKLSFINAISDICAAVHGDVTKLADTIGLDPRIGQSFLKAGIGYGGACLPKDVRGLAAFAAQVGTSGASEFLKLVDKINTSRRDLAIRMVEDAAGVMSADGHSQAEGRLSGRRIAVLGAAFKPDTDDVRDSPGLDVACRLRRLGAEVKVYDPMATGSALTVAPELTYADSAIAALDQAEVVVVVAAWPEFAEIDPVAAASVAASMTIVDACQGIDAITWQEAGWNVQSLTGTGAERTSHVLLADTLFRVPTTLQAL